MRHSLHVSEPIPSRLSPSTVIDALHDYGNIMTLHPLVTGWDEIDLPQSFAQDQDAHFDHSSSAAKIRYFNVDEAVVFIPGIGDWGKKMISFPGIFQDMEDGVKTRADAAGGSVVVRARWSVAKREEGGEIEEHHGEGGHQAWELTEDVAVECSAILMPFVRWSMESAHKEICKKLLAKIGGEEAGEK
ncbi:hypothetical protein K402DRAFT_391370 [Aulographum hederae CBS 113979]|uniref:DUF7053 domain-containing protein n=1 Tax=Aulographum hederae CBS 113979 TaxID=1176131 RepID=A0A6G1H7L3_9PEZI|nr:hypothetical protein K402DRAFT_391370 [Aulographum hederae CBS 113979]